MSKPRYLTKSRFKLATECPTKLFYTGKPEYADQKQADSFLLALAEGGFQVGELAKFYFPGGHDIHTLDHEDAIRETNQLLKQDEVVIYEAAIRFEHYFIRADVLVKIGNHFDLIEVKAKSVDSNGSEGFVNKGGTVRAEWKPYLYDVAFQKYVLLQAFPACSVSAYLMMADKSARCPVDGLNQKFRIVKDSSGRKSVEVSKDLSEKDLSEQILCQINVDSCCDQIFAGTDSKAKESRSFEERANWYAEHYARDEKIVCQPSMACAKCEFCTSDKEETEGLKSGIQECWTETLGWSREDFNEPTVFDIWNFRKGASLVKSGRIKISEVTEKDICPKTDSKPGISPSERRWLQVCKSQGNDQGIWVDRENMANEMGRWVYPLHFIDFETSMAAIPFNAGHHPYEGIAFQFSHHVVHEDDRIEHKGEYLNAEPGVFPSYDFVRALKKDLERDQGSIFRYSNHENTFLNMIYRQLMADSMDIPDRNNLCEFIQSITKSVRSSAEQWEGSRNMVDMWELVKRYYYDPYTNGSNSIKQVLPAILNSSSYLQEKYSQPIYGAPSGIPSLNFTDWQWIKLEHDKIIDPYKLLPKMFQDVSEKEFVLLSEADELSDGGAAMTAYARMQFEEMSDYEREEIRGALLKYCELDTMAMVMIYEGWKDML
jgi:hypothetical protein